MIYITTGLMIALSIALGNGLVAFVIYKVTMSERFMKEITKKAMSSTMEMIETISEKEEQL